MSPRTTQVSVKSDVVVGICHAIFLQRQIRVTMVRDEQNRCRQTKVSPYQVIAGPDGWDLIGRSSIDRRTVGISIAQIEHVELTEESYTVPCGIHNRRKLGHRSSLEVPSP